MAVGDKLKCGLALSPPAQRPVSPVGPKIAAVPAAPLRRVNAGSLSDALKTIGGGLQRNAEQRRQDAVTLILAGRCGDAQAYAMKAGDIDLTSRVQNVCTQRKP